MGEALGIARCATSMSVAVEMDEPVDELVVVAVDEFVDELVVVAVDADLAVAGSGLSPKPW